MNKQALSFMTLGVLLGVVLTSAAVSLIAGSSARASSTAARSDREPVVLKLAHVLDPAHPVHQAIEFMAKRLAERSGGALRLEIFPNGQLGSETESIEQVQRGALAMVKTSAAPLEGFIPEMAVFGLPYLFRDDEHYWRVLLGDIGQELLRSGADVGLRGLLYFDSGSRSFYTRGAPVRTPADLQGKKIRVTRSKTAMDMVAAMGGAPTPIPWGELYTALQQGMVDGAENNPPSLLSSRHFEVTTHFSLDEHTRVPDIILVSQKIWDALSPEARRWLSEAAGDAVAFQRKLWREKTAAALQQLEAAGVTLHHPEKEAFRARVQPMYDAVRNTRVGAIARRIREAGR